LRQADVFNPTEACPATFSVSCLIENRKSVDFSYRRGKCHFDFLEVRSDADGENAVYRFLSEAVFFGSTSCFYIDDMEMPFRTSMLPLL